MKISVIIPAYNSAKTIASTLDSVLAQTAPAAEILVMDDGSGDETPEIVRSYPAPVQLLRQSNSGAASARNALCAAASGDVAAFLDSDDLWHPRYLESQTAYLSANPQAAVSFTGHADLVGPADYRWHGEDTLGPAGSRLLSALEFLDFYSQAPGLFHMSFCCAPVHVLRELGGRPFRSSPAEDSYFKYRISLKGPVVYTPREWGAARIVEASASSNLLKIYKAEVQGFQLLLEEYKRTSDRMLYEAFEKAFASTRRVYAKHLMAAGEVVSARDQLKRSLRASGSAPSVAKSMALLLATWLPGNLQPAWPPVHRPCQPAVRDV